MSDVIPDADLAARARALIRAKGLRPAAAELGVPRASLLAVAAQVPIRRGTIAIIGAALDAAVSATDGPPPPRAA